MEILTINFLVLKKCKQFIRLLIVNLCSPNYLMMTGQLWALCRLPATLGDDSAAAPDGAAESSRRMADGPLPISQHAC